MTTHSLIAPPPQLLLYVNFVRVENNHNYRVFATAGQSGLLKFQLFDRMVDWVEIIVPDRKLMMASHIENTDLLYSAACAFGTLGTITLLQIQFVEIPTFVELAIFKP